MQVHTVQAPETFHHRLFFRITAARIHELRKAITAAPARQPLCMCPRCTAMHAYTGLQQLVLL